MSQWLPSRHDFLDWLALSQQPVEEARKKYLDTIEHPWIYAPAGNESWYRLLGVEDQMDLQTLLNGPIIMFKGLMELYRPRVSSEVELRQLYIDGKIFLNGPHGFVPIKFEQMWDWYLMRNKGITKEDRAMVMREGQRENLIALFK